MIQYRSKLINEGKNTDDTEKFSEQYFKDIIAKNIGYYTVKCSQDKSLEKFPLALQYDITKDDGDYK